MSNAEFNMSLLDKSIDDIDDLASFAVPPNGTYSLKVYTELKKVNDNECVEANFEVVDTVELADPTGTPPKTGDKFSLLFKLGHEVGEGKMKEFLAPFAAASGERNVAKLLTEVLHKDQGLIVVGTVKQRKDKEDPEKVYASVKNIQLA